ncbi:LOB domain-containing protein 29 [Ananas comosus]|uniref:LOB domain-containing protein 29 n=1 Tax=Ananas comosus TaxID=4615 RepID=A0A199URE4_ANACO|nr:LOB domain-containing protein 29 [Ananas comosus]
MTGFGSPCGACKFLRRKCAKGCVFAPYFSHEQGAAHFAAIHKVFGASNASKLLAHLPVADRCEAAVTISYEAQARVRDPIYGCVAHIFALQQQVVNLQAQVASLKAQARQGHINYSPSTLSLQEDNFSSRFLPSQAQHGSGFSQRPSNSINAETMLCYENGLLNSISFPAPHQCYDPHSYVNDDPVAFAAADESSSCAMATLDAQQDVQQTSFAYLNSA